MSKPTLSKSTRSKASTSIDRKIVASSSRRRSRRRTEKSDVLISAVISTYLLTHLHHILQRAEYGASQEGRASQAANFAQLRKVLYMDARSMEDASASGLQEGDSEKFQDSKSQSKVA